jgi:hypothetical protein
LVLARALLATEEGAAEGEQLALDLLEASDGDVRAAALGLAARADWRAGRTPLALERAQRALELLDGPRRGSWIELETRLLANALSLPETPSETDCSELAASLRSLQVSLGARHADVLELRRLLERERAFERCPQLR